MDHELSHGLECMKTEAIRDGRRQLDRFGLLDRPELGLGLADRKNPQLRERLQLTAETTLRLRGAIGDRVKAAIIARQEMDDPVLLAKAARSKDKRR
jgi:hypothetical protein